MGNNHRAAGFATVDAFVEAMMQSEVAQLNAFVSFVASDKTMLSALRRKDWAAFAKAYNGAGYRKNLYDEKLAAAYQRLSQSLAPGPASSATPAAGVTILPSEVALKLALVRLLAAYAMMLVPSGRRQRPGAQWTLHGPGNGLVLMHHIASALDRPVRQRTASTSVSIWSAWID